MEGLGQLKESVVKLLAADAAFEGARLLAEYPALRREYPLEQAVVAVGVDSVETSPAGFGGFLGEGGAAGALYGECAVITLRFDIYVPRSGGDAHLLFEALCQRLLLADNAMGFLKISGERIAFDKTVGAERLTAKASLRVHLAQVDYSLAVEKFHVSRTEGSE